MIAIASIVEGDGEVSALPVLLRSNAKGWMRERMSGGSYREILDQPAFAARIDVQQACGNSRSFRKLRTEWEVHVCGRS